MHPTDIDALLNALGRLPQRLSALLNTEAPECWNPSPPAGVFSLVEHLCHLRDLEAEGYQPRIRRLLQEDLPTLHEIDGSQWAVERRYAQQSAPQALQAFTRLRGQTLAMLREALPLHAGRRGLFGGFGIVTLAGLAHEMLRHDQGHLEEIEALLRA